MAPARKSGWASSLVSSTLTSSALEGSPSLAYGAALLRRLGSVPREFESRAFRAVNPEGWQSGDCSGPENRRPAGPWVRVPHLPLTGKQHSRFVQLADNQKDGGSTPPLPTMARSSARRRAALLYGVRRGFKSRRAYGPLAQWQSGRLLIGWFRVRAPGGPRCAGTVNRIDPGPSKSCAGGSNPSRRATCRNNAWRRAGRRDSRSPRPRGGQRWR